jgi:hypothetical protein
LKKELNFEVETSFGTGVLKEFYISEIGFLMAKIWYPNEKKFINQNVGNIIDFLNNSNITPLENWTKKLKFQ